MNLFHADISNWDSWGAIFQNVAAFEPMIQYIFKRHGLPFTRIEQLTPGSNAVFKVDSYVVKIFAPKESGLDNESDYKTEQFGLERANRLGLYAPQLVAAGVVADKYQFLYFVLEYIHGDSFDVSKLNDSQKRDIGQQLRYITNKLDTPCERFNSIRVIEKALNSDNWRDFSERFRAERLNFVSKVPPKPLVYVHGDIHKDNAIIMNGKLYIFDFADALLAPVEYEMAALIPGLFNFERPFLDGYFGEYDFNDLTDRLLYGLLLHAFGKVIIRDHIGSPETIDSIAMLREKIAAILKR